MELIQASELARRLCKTTNCIYSETSAGKWKGYSLKIGRKRLYDWGLIEPWLRSLIQEELARAEAGQPEPIEASPPDTLGQVG